MDLFTQDRPGMRWPACTFNVAHGTCPPSASRRAEEPRDLPLTSLSWRAPRPPAPRPPLLLLGTEPLRAAAEYFANRVQPHPPGASGDGHPVVIFPGLASDGHAVAPLRAHCQRLGYEAMDWGRGWNTGPNGDIDRWLGLLAADVQRLVGVADAPVTLIGWSLGGLYARELAKLGRLRVRQVITLGTPFNGTPAQTHAAWVYRLLNGEHARPSPALRRRLAAAPPVPTTSIYSRGDGVVAWQSCCHDRPAPRVQDVQVQGSHLGMAWNPKVLRVVADRLAQPAGDWRPYAAAGG